MNDSDWKELFKNIKPSDVFTKFKDTRDILRDYIKMKIAAYSEEMYYAGWHTGIEIVYWNDKDKNELAVKAARMLGEWPFWDEDEGGDIKWVPIKEWERLVNQ